MLLGIYLLFVYREGVPKPQGFIRHVVAILLSVGVITFSGALIDTVAFLEDDPFVYLAAALLIACISIFVAVRYVGLPMRYGLVGGVLFFIVNIVTWSAGVDWFWALMGYTKALTVLLCAFAIILVTEAGWLHQIVHLEPGPRIKREVPVQDGLWRRYSTWLMANWMYIEAALLCGGLLTVVIYLSIHPIFQFKEYQLPPDYWY
jgi:hypothetical protein